MTNVKESRKALDALNVINDRAECGVTEYEQEQELGKAYDIVADFIYKHQ